MILENFDKSHQDLERLKAQRRSWRQLEAKQCDQGRKEVTRSRNPGTLCFGRCDRCTKIHCAQCQICLQDLANLTNQCPPDDVMSHLVEHLTIAALLPIWQGHLDDAIHPQVRQAVEDHLFLAVSRQACLSPVPKLRKRRWRRSLELSS